MSVELLVGCATTATVKPSETASSTLEILKGGVEPKTLDVDQQEAATIRYELTQPASVTIDLVGEEGRVVRQLDGGRQSAGMHTMTWDGHATDDQPVPSGVYRYIIKANTTDYTYDPSRETGGEELEVWKFTFEKETGTLRWVMPKAGYARLRVGVQGFPHLRTLMDWTPLEAGKHELLWDGLDASGLIRLSEHPNLSIKLHAFAMPWNTIIVKHQQTADRTQWSDLTTNYERRTTNSLYPPLDRPDATYLHARHPRARCREPKIRVEFPAYTRYDTEGRPVLNGSVPVRVVVDERDAVPLVNARFEVALFEDTIFLFEEEEGSNPFTYLWDTTRLTPGEHLLTVNVLSYDDHYGIATRQVLIERGS